MDNCKQSPSSVQEGKRAELTQVEFVGNNVQVKSKDGSSVWDFPLMGWATVNQLLI